MKRKPTAKTVVPTRKEKTNVLSIEKSDTMEEKGLFENYSSVRAPHIHNNRVVCGDAVRKRLSRRGEHVGIPDETRNDTKAFIRRDCGDTARRRHLSVFL